MTKIGVDQYNALMRDISNTLQSEHDRGEHENVTDPWVRDLNMQQCPSCYASQEHRRQVELTAHAMGAHNEHRVLPECPACVASFIGHPRRPKERVQ